MQEAESANALDRSELGGVKLPEPVLVAGSIQSRIVRCRELRDRASTRVDRGVIRIERGTIVADCYFTGRVDERLHGHVESGERHHTCGALYSEGFVHEIEVETAQPFERVDNASTGEPSLPRSR